MKPAPIPLPPHLAARVPAEVAAPSSVLARWRYCPSRCWALSLRVSAPATSSSKRWIVCRNGCRQTALSSAASMLRWNSKYYAPCCGARAEPSRYWREASQIIAPQQKRTNRLPKADCCSLAPCRRKPSAPHARLRSSATILCGNSPLKFAPRISPLEVYLR